MKTIITTGAAMLTIAAVAQAQAQMAALSFEQAAYVTCRDAHAMEPASRIALATSLANHVARHRGVMVPDDQRGGELALLIRGGCTLAPDAYLFTVIDRAILAEKDKLPKP